MTEHVERNRPGRHATLTAAGLFFVLSAAIWYAFSREMYFSADGAHYFARILDKGSVLNVSWTRLHADVATQWPLVLAVKLGVADLGILKCLYALGLYLPYLVAGVLSVYALRGTDREALVFPLAAYLLVSFPAAYIWVGESHVMAVAAWPALFLLLRPTPSRVDVALLLLLLFFLSRTYETSAAVALVFVAVCLIRVLREGPECRGRLLLVLAAAVLVFGVNAYSAAFPVSAQNRSGFVAGITRTLRNPNLVCALLAFSLLALAIWRQRASLLLGAVAVGVVATVLALLGITVSAHVSFDSRSLTLTLLPLLLLAASVFVFRQPRMTPAQRAGIGAVFVLLTAANVISWNDWARFRGEFERVLTHNRGYIPVEHTPLRRDRSRWGWTSPILSVLWSGGCVRAVVLNPPNTVWEPFDPRATLPLQSYFRFGIPFRGVVSQARLCE